MFSSLTANDRMAAIASVVLIITGLISISTAWGPLVIISVLAAVLALFAVLQPQVAPTVKLPMTKGVLLVAAGAAATVVLLVVALDWLGYIIGNLLNLDTIQFAIGVAAAIVLLVSGFRAYQAEKGVVSAPAEAPPAPPAPPAV
jgi:hypothetical protein